MLGEAPGLHVCEVWGTGVVAAPFLLLLLGVDSFHTTANVYLRVAPFRAWGWERR